jgi:hypothetical protein
MLHLGEAYSDTYNNMIGSSLSKVSSIDHGNKGIYLSDSYKNYNRIFCIQSVIYRS